MGNIVVSEALELGGVALTSYVASQAASVGGAYGNTIFRKIVEGVLTDPTQSWYRMFYGKYPIATGATPYFRNLKSSVANLTNFFNPDDHALSRWEIGQNLKPVDTLLYSYDGDLGWYRGTALTGEPYSQERTGVRTRRSFNATDMKYFLYCSRVDVRPWSET